MSVTGGRIQHKDAYIQGKMLNHEKWQGKLPRSGTPSDLDMHFNDDKYFLMCEVAKGVANWANLKTGQRLSYTNLAKKEGITCVLCSHSVPVDQEIDSHDNVDWFNVMHRFPGDTNPRESGPIPGAEWPGFVDGWHTDRDRILSAIFRL